MPFLSPSHLITVLLFCSTKSASCAAAETTPPPQQRIFDPKQSAVMKELDQADDLLMSCIRNTSNLWQAARPSRGQCLDMHRNLFSHAKHILTPALFAALRTDRELQICAAERAYKHSQRSYWGRAYKHSQRSYWGEAITYSDPIGDKLQQAIADYSCCIAPKAYGSAHIDKTELDDCRSELAWQVNQVLAEKHAKELAAWTAQAILAKQRLEQQCQLKPATTTLAAGDTSKLAMAPKGASHDLSTITERAKDSWNW